LNIDPGSREALQRIRALVQGELRAVDEAIRRGFHSAVPLVDQVAEHIIDGGGKRLRPLLVVLAGRACSSTEPACIHAAATPPMKSMATRPACWSATLSIRALSSSWRPPGRSE
jgi:hypothetical protein